MRRRVAAVGVAESDHLGTQPGISRLALHAQSARNALADAGLTLKEVDGLLCAGANPAELAEYLQVVPRYVDGTSVGGCSFLILVRHAAAAIAAGYCDVALITHGESGRSRVGVDQMTMGTAAGQFEAPFGALGAPSTFSLPVTRHMHQYGTTKRHMAHVAAATREWALLNPRAIMHDQGPITPDDVLNSRLICWPFNLFDCCLVADGGGAIVLVSAERARDFPHPPVYLLGAGESVAHWNVSQMRDFTTSDCARVSGREAFRMAGVEPKDIDHVMFYDAFTSTPMFALEDLGFVKPGESGPFFSETRKGPDGRVIYKSGPGGDFPMNTNGGGLSYCHTGMYGMFAIIESVRQVRGGCGPRQAPDVTVGLTHGPGGIFAAAATLIWTNQ